MSFYYPYNTTLVLVSSNFAFTLLLQVCLPAVGVVGIVGNLLAILILLRPEMKSTFHHTLITLAVVDTLLVIILIVDCQRPDLNLDNQIFIMFFPYCWNPAKNILMTFETFLIMSITTERYLAIRKPLVHRFSRSRLSSSIHLAAYILPPLLLSVLLNLPKFLELRLIWLEVEDETTGATVHLLDYNVTSLRLDPDYILYYTQWTRLVTTGLLPFAYLLLVNLALVRKIQEQGRCRHSSSTGEEDEGDRYLTTLNPLSRSQSSKKSVVSIRVNRKSNNERLKPSNSNKSSGTSILIAIVLIYLSCNVPRLVLNLTEHLLEVNLKLSVNLFCPG